MKFGGCSRRAVPATPSPTKSPDEASYGEAVVEAVDEIVILVVVDDVDVVGSSSKRHDNDDDYDVAGVFAWPP